MYVCRMLFRESLEFPIVSMAFTFDLTTMTERFLAKARRKVSVAWFSRPTTAMGCSRQLSFRAHSSSSSSLPVYKPRRQVLPLDIPRREDEWSSLQESKTQILSPSTRFKYPRSLLLSNAAVLTWRPSSTSSRGYPCTNKNSGSQPSTMAQLPAPFSGSCYSALRYTHHCRLSQRGVWKKFDKNLPQTFSHVFERYGFFIFCSHTSSKRLSSLSRDCSIAAKQGFVCFYGTRPRLNSVVDSMSEFAYSTTGCSTITNISIHTVAVPSSAVSTAPSSPLLLDIGSAAALRNAVGGAIAKQGFKSTAAHSCAFSSSADAGGVVAAQQKSGTSPHGRRVCVVGAGPAGFYCAKYLLQAAAGLSHTDMRQQSSALKVDDLKNKVTSLRVDMLERLPAPYGLVRYGVAPDHPEIKHVADDFDIVAQNPSFRYFGNVELGKDVSLQELRSLYDAVIVAYGAAGDRQPKLEGSDRLLGCLSARNFVGYYNAHPDVAATVEARLPCLSEKRDGLHPSVALVIGNRLAIFFDLKMNGNVSLDVARLLTKCRKKLQATDVHGPALTWIRRANLRLVIVLGRRGWVQASFTNKELRELVKADDLLAVVDPEDYNNSLTEASRKELSESRTKQRSAPLLEQMVKNWERRNNVDCPVVHFRFLASPVRTIPHPDDLSRLGGVEIARNELRGEPFHQQAIRAKEDHVEHVSCSLLIWSIGFKCVHPQTVEFPTGKDGALKNNFGLVVSCSVKKEGQRLASVFASGWARRGPHGVIASNIMDAREVATSVLKNLEEDVGEGDLLRTRLKQREGSAASVQTRASVSDITNTVTHSAMYHESAPPEPILKEAGVAGSVEACNLSGGSRSLQYPGTEDKGLSAHCSATENRKLTAAVAFDRYVPDKCEGGESTKKVESKSLLPACEDIATLLRRRGVQFVTFDDWICIKSVERAMGQEEGKAAVKIATASEMLRIAKERSAAVEARGQLLATS